MNSSCSWFIIGGGKIKRSLILVLLVTIFLGLTAVSAADTNSTSDVTDDVCQDVTETTQTKSVTNIESNSIENKVSNEYETITNGNSSTNSKTLTKQDTTTTTTKTEETDKQNVYIKTGSITTYAEQLIKINATVNFKNGETLNDAKVAIKINGNTIGQTRVTNGSITYDYAVPKWSAKTYTLTIIVGETSTSLTSTKDVKFTIKRHDVNIDMSSIKALSAAQQQINATVKYENGTVADGQKAVFKINGKTIGNTTVNNGVASITYIVPAKANNYSLVVKIGESTISKYNEATTQLVVTTRTPTISTDVLFFVKENNKVTLKANITDTGNAYATGKVAFKVNGKTVATVDLEDGYASYRYDASNLKKGTHNVTIVYSGSSALEADRTNTSLRVQSDLVSTYTYSQILEKANLTYEFIIKNKQLPNYALMNGNEVSMADFLYLLTQTITYNNSFHNGGFSTPTTNTKTSQYDVKIYKDDYVALAKTIVDSYIQNGMAPNTIKTNSGVILSFEDAVYCYTRIVAFIYSNNCLSNYNTVVTMGTIPGSGSSSSSQSSSVVEPVNTDTSSSSTQTSDYKSTNSVPSGYEKYLTDAKNAYVNSTTLKNAVKSAVSGVSGTYNQAVAIFNYVNDKTSYSSYFDTKYGALTTLKLGYGNCVDQSHLLLGMYRTANIPARYCHATCYFRSGLVVGHVWVEVYVNGKWYSCDTTSNQNTFGKIVNWYSSTTVYRYTELYF